MSFAVKSMAVAALSALAAHANAADAPASPVDAAEAAVLKCHADYVRQVTGKRYGIGLGASVPGVTASEIAHASAAACRPALDAYARKVREARETSAPVDVDEYVKSKVDALGEYAFDYTLDAYIKLQD